LENPGLLKKELVMMFKNEGVKDMSFLRQGRVPLNNYDCFIDQNGRGNVIYDLQGNRIYIKDFSEKVSKGEIPARYDMSEFNTLNLQVLDFESEKMEIASRIKVGLVEIQDRINPKINAYASIPVAKKGSSVLTSAANYALSHEVVRMAILRFDEDFLGYSGKGEEVNYTMEAIDIFGQKSDILYFNNAKPVSVTEVKSFGDPHMGDHAYTLRQIGRYMEKYPSINLARTFDSKHMHLIKRSSSEFGCEIYYTINMMSETTEQHGEELLKFHKNYIV
jgi:hypothetical protein